MSDIKEEQIRTLIAQFKEIASQSEGMTSEELAQAWFVQEESFHGDWNILSPATQHIWERIAAAALREIETGKPTPLE